MTIIRFDRDAWDEIGGVRWEDAKEAPLLFLVLLPLLVLAPLACLKLGRES